MTDETRVEQLLDEILDSGRTPEEVCADCPALLPEVRKRSQTLLRITEMELEAMFPTPDPGAAWESSTKPGICASNARSLSRCCSPGLCAPAGTGAILKRSRGRGGITACEYRPGV